MRQAARSALPCAVAAVSSGALLSVCFPPADLGWLSWVALVPLLAALQRVQRARDGFFLGSLAGGVFFALLLLFIGQYGMLPWLALAAYQGLYVAVFGTVAVPLLRVKRPVLRVIAVGGLWALVELARGRAGALAFTFGGLGLAQHGFLPLLQAASLIGSYGLSFVVATTNAALAATLVWGARSRAERYGPLIVCAAAVALLVGWGGWELHRRPVPVSGQGFSVVAVQNNEHTVPGVHEADSWQQLSLNATLSKRAASEDTNLVIWSETAVTAVIGPGTAYHEDIGAVARRLGTWLLAGGLDLAPPNRLYNAAYLFGPDGRSWARYYKARLVLYGEYVPLRKQLKFLERYPIRQQDLSAGPGPSVMDIGGVRCGPMICFESIFPEISRETVRRGAEVLLILTSDAWAGDTPEVWQHAYCSVLRAVETRRPVVRCASTGVTCAINAYGEIVAALPAFEQGALTAEVQPGSKVTLYQRLGDAPLGVVWLLLVVAGLWSIRRDPARHRAAGSKKVVPE